MGMSFRRRVYLGPVSYRKVGYPAKPSKTWLEFGIWYLEFTKGGLDCFARRASKAALGGAI